MREIRHPGVFAVVLKGRTGLLWKSTAGTALDFHNTP